MKEQDRLEGAPEKAGGSDLAVAAAPVGAPQEEHRRQDPFRVERRHYQRRSEDRRRRQRAQWTIMALGALLVLETVVLAVVYVRMSIAEKEHAELASTVRESAALLERLRPELPRLETQIAALARARVPGLRPLEFDRVIPINAGFVRNILFTTSGTRGQKIYEYQAVVHNPTAAPVHLHLRLSLFNAAGVEIGRAGEQGSRNPPLEIVLQPGEVVSLTGKIRMDEEEGNAVYFML